MAATHEQWTIEGALLRLKNNAGGEAWEMFLKALDQECDNVTAAVITAPRDQLEIKQGQAQMALKFKRWFHEAKSPSK
jgi:hypothetical protein